jgi:hypothetical protein
MNGSGKTVWYILTDVSDPEVASLHGLLYSAKLHFAINGARTATFDAHNNLVFDKGRVDFTPVRTVVSDSPAPFRPATAQPGSVGDQSYSPLVRVGNIILEPRSGWKDHTAVGKCIRAGKAFRFPSLLSVWRRNDINFPNGVDYSNVHDEVLAIDPVNITVTLQAVNGFSLGRPIWYISMDVRVPDVAAIEGAPYVPLMHALVTGRHDSFSSPVERLFIAVNGPSDHECANPMGQGIFAVLTEGHRPNYVFGGIPTIAPDDSPLWNGQPVRVDAGCHQQWLSRSATRGVPDSYLRTGWDSDRT